MLRAQLLVVIEEYALLLLLMWSVAVLASVTLLIWCDYPPIQIFHEIFEQTADTTI